MLKIIKWLILAAAYAFLAYKLATYDGYGILLMQWQQSSWHDWIPLLLMLALLPINWAIEAKKWQMLCRPFEPQPFTQALQAVLGALVPAFITPNRIGEIVGRPMFLKKENRIAGAAADSGVPPTHSRGHRHRRRRCRCHRRGCCQRSHRRGRRS